MKKSIWTLAIATVITGNFIAGCSTPAEKVQDAQASVVDANTNLDQANQAYMADMAEYKKTTEEKIAANQKSIADFRERIAKDKAEARAEYTQKLDELEKKNTDMKKSLDDYKADGKDKWETFKTDFSHNMDGLGNSFKDLTDKKVK